MAKRKYLYLAMAGLALNLVETWLFGWHWKAQSGAESFWDSFSLILVVWGVIGDIASNVQIHKHHTSTTNINTQKVEFKDEPKIMNYNVGIKNSEAPK